MLWVADMTNAMGLRAWNKVGEDTFVDFVELWSKSGPKFQDPHITALYTTWTESFALLNL